MLFILLENLFFFNKLKVFFGIRSYIYVDFMRLLLNIMYEYYFKDKLIS